MTEQSAGTRPRAGYYETRLPSYTALLETNMNTHPSISSFSIAGVQTAELVTASHALTPRVQERTGADGNTYLALAD